jgi:hypothetical protein
MFVLVNLKAYPCDPVAVAEAARDVAEESGVRVAVAPQAAHLDRVAATGVETWAQHVAPVAHGSHTGHTLAEALTDAGAEGTLLNHSERRLKLADIDAALDAAERTGLETVVCANNPDQVGAANPPNSSAATSPSARPTPASSRAPSPPRAPSTPTWTCTAVRASRPATTWPRRPTSAPTACCSRAGWRRPTIRGRRWNP